MNRAQLKQLIRESIEEVMNEFAPLGVADEGRLDEKAPPHFPRALEKKLLAQYKDTPQKAYATMWKIHNAKNEGNERVCEMWTAWENKSVNEADEVAPEAPEGEVDHDETDLSNPEEAREVELAKKIKELANELLNMHGAEEASPEGEEGEEGGEEGTEEADEETEK
jgi:hypothetical protein